jgi:hypothetical protein
MILEEHFLIIIGQLYGKFNVLYYKKLQVTICQVQLILYLGNEY